MAKSSPFDTLVCSLELLMLAYTSLEIFKAKPLVGASFSNSNWCSRFLVHHHQMREKCKSLLCWLCFCCIEGLLCVICCTPVQYKESVKKILLVHHVCVRVSSLSSMCWYFITFLAFDTLAERRFSWRVNVDKKHRLKFWLYSSTSNCTTKVGTQS